MPVFQGKAANESAQLLGKVPIFASASERELKHLARDGAERTYKEGAAVVSQGEKGIGLYLVLDGKVEVRRKGRRLATLGPGQFFGEMSIFDDQPRSADVVAVVPTRCLVLSKWEFWGYANHHTGLLRGMLEEMARRLRATDQALSE